MDRYTPLSPEQQKEHLLAQIAGLEKAVAVSEQAKVYVEQQTARLKNILEKLET